MVELHKPVLLSKVIECLNPKDGETYLDLTAGYAGHANEILRRIIKAHLLLIEMRMRLNFSRRT